jgi:hypothetical protein
MGIGYRGIRGGIRHKGYRDMRPGLHHSSDAYSRADTSPSFPSSPSAASCPFSCLYQLGDILLKVDGKKVSTAEEAAAAILGDQGSAVHFHLQREWEVRERVRASERETLPVTVDVAVSVFLLCLSVSLSKDKRQRYRRSFMLDTIRMPVCISPL